MTKSNSLPNDRTPLPATPLSRMVIALALTAAIACEHMTLPTSSPPPAAAETSDIVPNDDVGRRANELTVMTYNVYQGTELQNSLAATNAQEFVVGAAQDFLMMRQTNFRERAEAIASQIQAADPDLVGLQEVALWRTGATQFPAVPATTVEQDFLQILLDALAARGIPYTAVSSVQNLDVEGPALFPSGFTDVRLTDRNVVLAKAEGATARMRLSNPQSGNFVTNLIAPTAGGPVPVLEGWASIDVRLAGHTVRFITTHLDAFAPPIRLAQAQEILSGIASTTTPVILVGDLNSTTSASSYAALTGGGFVDVWNELHHGVDGFTCCEVLPTIDNTVPALSERIDYVLTRGSFDFEGVEEVGATPSSRTTSGLWPSDHAGLVAKLRFQPVQVPVTTPRQP